MKCYCETCKIKDCQLREQINFCEDCKDYDDCTIKESCEAGYDIECNNGFEPCDDFDDSPEYDSFLYLFTDLLKDKGEK